MIKLISTYFFIFITMTTAMALMPMEGGYFFEPVLIVTLCAALFTLMVYLVAHLADIGDTPIGVGLTALFLLLFAPGSNIYLQRDEVAVMELGSQCIVPFFISQYNRVSQKNFRRWYALMLLMGIFCSYTHDGITIPLCVSFLWLAYKNRHDFFRSACWPMVVGFLIGTTLSIWKAYRSGGAIPADLTQMTEQTSLVLQTLWDTKIFVLTIALVAYLSTRKTGRRLMRQTFKKHSLLSYCGIFALCSVPFTPLGLDNAVTGVCFFGMFWSLIICRELIRKRRIILQEENHNNIQQ